MAGSGREAGIDRRRRREDERAEIAVRHTAAGVEEQRGPVWRVRVVVHGVTVTDPQAEIGSRVAWARRSYSLWIPPLTSGYGPAVRAPEPSADAGQDVDPVEVGAVSPPLGGATAAGRGRLGLWLAIISVAAAVGIGARLYGLGDKPIWHDEVYTRIFAAGHQSSDWLEALYVGRPVARDEILAFQRLDPERGPFDTVRGLARDEPQHPPAYYLLARVWMGLFGDGLGPLRALSVLASLLALWAAAWLGRELYAPRGPPDPEERAAAERARWAIAGLVAASPFAVLYAQEAREYAWWSVWVLASSAGLLRGLRVTDADAPRGRQLRAWAGYALLSALGLYTAFSHATVILAQVVFVAWRERGRLTRASVSAASALVVSGLLFLPWALLLAEHLEAFRASMSWSSAIVVPRMEVVTTLMTNLSRPILDLWPVVEGPLAWVAALATVALVVGSLVHFGRRGPRRERALIVLLFVVPVALLVVPDLAVGGIRSFSARYLFPAFLAALVAVAHRLATIERPRLRWGLAALVFGVAALSCARTTSDDVPWIRQLSAGLPAVATAVDATHHPVVVADRERHHPGNILALATQVDPDTTFVLYDFADRDALVARAEAQAGTGAWPPPGVPAGHDVFVYSPVPQLLEALEGAVGTAASAVYRDPYIQCWRLEPPAGAGRAESVRSWGPTP